MKIFKVVFLISSLLICKDLYAKDEMKIQGVPEQGAIVKINAKGFEKAVLGQREYKVAPNGDLLIAFEREEPEMVNLALIDKNGKATVKKLKVADVKWDIQEIIGVPQKTVTPSQEDEKEIADERKKVRGALIKDEDNLYWQNGFIQPVEGRISGKFGGQRIMNGQKKNPHAGIDIAAPKGTPIKSSADGVVTLAAPDLFYSGSVVIVDHGYNLQTIYAHLDEIDVKEGAKVKKGEVIGKVGMTGRATGPHLHWGASLRGVRFDPLTLLRLNKDNTNAAAKNK